MICSGILENGGENWLLDSAFGWIDGRWRNESSDKNRIAFMLNSNNNIRNLRKKNSSPTMYTILN